MGSGRAPRRRGGGAHDAPVDLVAPGRVVDRRAHRGERPTGGVRWEELTPEEVAATSLLGALRRPPGDTAPTPS